MKKDFIETAKKTLLVVVFGCALTGIFGALGCNTVHGLGQDIERGGEKTQGCGGCGETTHVEI